MDEMKFIMPFVKMTVPYQLTAKNALEEEENTSTKNTDEDEDSPSGGKRRILRGRRVKPDPVEEQRECEEYEVVLDDSFTQATSAGETDKKRLIRSLIQEIDTDNETYSINYGEVKTQKRKYSASETDNPRKMFLLSLLPEMEQMTDKQMSGFRRKVLALLDDILYGDE